jgi:transposase-like protein
MKEPTILTMAQRVRVAREYAEGVALKQVAHRYGVHPSTVVKIATRLGVERRNGVRTIHALGRAASRLGLTVKDLESFARSRVGSRSGQPMHGGPDQYEERQASI